MYIVGLKRVAAQRGAGAAEAARHQQVARADVARIARAEHIDHRRPPPALGGDGPVVHGEVGAGDVEAGRPVEQVTVLHRVGAVVDARVLHVGVLVVPARAGGPAEAVVVFGGDGGEVRAVDREVLAEERPVVAHLPAARGGERAERVVAAEDRRARGQRVANRVRDVDADRAKLLAEPTVQRRRCDRVRRGPQRVDVLARRREEEGAGQDAHAVAAGVQLGLDVRLHDADAAMLRSLGVVARE